TDWGGRSLVETARRISDYEGTAGAFRREIAARSGTQPGDPRKAALAIVRAVTSHAPPLRLLLGRDALTFARDKIEVLSDEIDLWSPVTLGTSFDEPTSAGALIRHARERTATLLARDEEVRRAAPSADATRAIGGSSTVIESVAKAFELYADRSCFGARGPQE